MTPGFSEMLIIFFIIVLLFGAKKLPELARGLGKGLKEFKQATKEPEELDEASSKSDVGTSEKKES